MTFLGIRSSDWFDIAVIAAIVKLICAIVSARWPGGANSILKTWRGRLLYAAGKITPLIAVGAVLTYYKLSDPFLKTWWLILLFAAVFFYDAYVVWLRLIKQK
jgi:hypothetical protein